MFSVNIKPFIKTNKNHIVLVLFAVIIAVFYGNTLFNGFAHDDIGQIVRNEYVHSLKYLPKVVTGCTWEYIFGGCKDSNYYRPTHSLSYLLTWQFSSQPWFFHLVNLIYFFVAVFSVFLLIKELTNNFIISFLTALFFLIHPLNNEVINWAAAVPELLFTIFIVLATLFFVRYRKRDQRKYLIFCPLFYFFALLSKEPAVFLPLLFLFLDWKVFNKKIFYYEETSKDSAETEDFDLGIRINFNEIKIYLILLFPLFIYFLMRFLVLKSIIGASQFYFGIFSFSERFYAFITLFGKYLEKFFFPYPLLFFYYFEKNSNFLSWEFLASLLGFLVFCGSFLFFLKKKANLAAFFLLWIFVFLWPVLFFVYSAGENLFSERYLFSSTIGFSFVIAFGFHYLWQERKTLRPYFLFFLIFLAVACWLVIFPRNKIFKNDKALYGSTLKINPLAHSIRRNLAVELMEEGEYERAREELEFILNRADDWWEIDKVYSNLADYYRFKKDFPNTVKYYEKALEVSGDWNYKPYNNLAALYIERQEYLRAMLYLCQALRLGPQAPEVNNNLNRLIMFFDSIETEKGLQSLYNDIIAGNVFSETPEEKIKYLDKNCKEDFCQLIFSSKVTEQEVLLPFLIVGLDSQTNKAVLISGKSFDPQQRLIGLEVSKEEGDNPITFIFPTCEGIYYRAEAQPENYSLNPKF